MWPFVNATRDTQVRHVKVENVEIIATTREDVKMEIVNAIQDIKDWIVVSKIV